MINKVIYKGNILKRIGILLCFIITIVGANINSSFIDQQSVCITLGNNLIDQCVEDDGDLEYCLPIYISYLNCITQLNKPLELIYKKEIDNYPSSSFSPCGYEISHLILSNKCY